MATCDKCRHVFRTPPGEEQEHPCPRCGWHPEQDEQEESDDLPQLNDAKQAALDSLPDDLPERLKNGEWWDGARFWTAKDAVERITWLNFAIQTAWLDGYRNGEIASRSVVALRRYASHAPLDLLSPRELQADLLAIAGNKHMHRASIGSDACWICGRDLRDAVHERRAV